MRYNHQVGFTERWQDRSVFCLPSLCKVPNKTTHCEFKTICYHIIKLIIPTTGDTCSADSLSLVLHNFQLFSRETFPAPAERPPLPGEWEVWQPGKGKKGGHWWKEKEGRSWGSIDCQESNKLDRFLLWNLQSCSITQQLATYAEVWKLTPIVRYVLYKV